MSKKTLSAALALLFTIGASSAAGQKGRQIKSLKKNSQLSSSLSKRSKRSIPFGIKAETELRNSLNRRMRGGGSSVFKSNLMNKLQKNLSSSASKAPKEFGRQQAQKASQNLSQKSKKTGRELKKSKDQGSGKKPRLSKTSK